MVVTLSYNICNILAVIKTTANCSVTEIGRHGRDFVRQLQLFTTSSGQYTSAARQRGRVSPRFVGVLLCLSASKRDRRIFTKLLEGVALEQKMIRFFLNLLIFSYFIMRCVWLQFFSDTVYKLYLY